MKTTEVSIIRWMDKKDYIYICVYIYIYFHIKEYNSAIKKNEILLFAATWMDLVSIMLSEMSHRKINIV